MALVGSGLRAAGCWVQVVIQRNLGVELEINSLGVLLITCVKAGTRAEAAAAGNGRY